MKPPKNAKPEEVETVPDAWERFERAVDVLAHTPPKPHRKLVRGMKAVRGTAETDADPRNPNVVTESDPADCKADST